MSSVAMFFDHPMEAVLRFLALLPALVGHEFAHAYSADKMGDPTPRMQGRLSLNPLAHLDPVGTIMILFGPIGWAKPVQVNPLNFRDPARGMMISTACGPLSNLIQGSVFGLVLRLVLASPDPLALHGDLLIALLAMLVTINYILAFFNMIPLGPLDGHHILEYFLPYPAKEDYRRFNYSYGMVVLVVLIALPFLTNYSILSPIIFTPAMALATLVVGANPMAVFYYIMQ